MIPSWLTSWYQYNEEQQQQLQEPFNDQYETTDDWVEVITPAIMKKRQIKPEIPVVPEKADDDASPTKKNKTTDEIEEQQQQDDDEPPAAVVVKKLSRQERRAKARLAAREMKKQARNAAMVINRGKGLQSCLPATPLTTN